MKKCYIVGAGEFYGSFEKKEGDLVIAADGGYDTLRKLSVSADLLIGDMDSIGTNAREVKKLLFPVKKDETDSFLAYLEGVKRGYTDFELYGCVGGRDDHTFANYSLLIYAKNRGHNIKLIGKVCDTFAIKNESRRLSGKPNSHFSAFAFGGDAEGVTIKGLEYEAEDITLSPEFPLAVSNRFTDKEAFVEVRSGTLLIMTEVRDPSKD